MPEIKIITGQRVVTAAGTPEQIAEAADMPRSEVIAVNIQANPANTGNIFIAPEAQRAAILTAGRILVPAGELTLDVHDFLDGWLDLRKIWVDAAVSGEGLSYVAFEVIR